jgi:hypothetical protein
MGTRRSGAALALLTIELGGRPVGWSSSRRSGGSDRGCLRLTPRCSGCGEKIIFSAWIAADHHDDLGDRDAVIRLS